MKIISFNVNGVRARPHQLQRLVELHQPDIIGLQETKVNDPEFPLEAIQQLGYECIYHGQKGHYGVALLYKRSLKVNLKSSIKGLPGQDKDAQRRFVQASFKVGEQTLHVINGYFPQGENRDHPEKFPNKADYYLKLQQHLSAFDAKDNIIVMGDVNIAPQDIDIGIGEDNRKRWLRTGKCGFLPEEREWLEQIIQSGFTDSFRHLHPEEPAAYSWFDYRSRGFERDPKRGLRIDLILTSKGLTQHIQAAGIDTEIRGMEKPSDHCPIWLELSI